ncbi:heat shock factor-binding protein 1 [Tribonema minus]|uniref:Heat shock factor-binding protein 1 n=1 Tax=Tribonema minus TaxID=303371 RepID=A0A835YY59_9STRA|nr:heat shock factor-binding protein 1 [Tribonema minus]
MADNSHPKRGASGEDTHADEDLIEFVQGVLEQMQTRFQQMSDTIIGRVDEMGARLDDLEKSIADLMEATGVEGAAGGDGKDETQA